MLFKPGFLNTLSPLYLDIGTIYFILLPFLLIIAINYARKKEYKKHFVLQFITLFATILMIVVFEIGIRIDGGYLKYSQYSSFDIDFLFNFLIVHIIIAVLTIIYWIYFLFNSYSNYSLKTLKKSHKKSGILLFSLICLTSIMGVCIYIFLFVF